MVIIKILLINIVLILTVRVFSQTIDNSKNLSKNYTGQSLSSVLDDIRNQTGVNFVYQDNLVEGLIVNRRVTCRSVENLIDKILESFNISYKKFPNNSYVLYKRKIPIEKHFRAVIENDYSSVTRDTSVLIEPKLISNNTLVYPPEAIKNSIEGKVKLNLLINKDGNVCRTELEQSSGSAILDSAAIEYSYQLKFIPAKVEGQPRNIWVAMHFKYYLENRSSIIL